MGMGFLFQVKKMFHNYLVVMVHNFVAMLKTIDFYTLKGVFMVCKL